MRELTPSEESFLDAFLKALYKINPSLHNNLSRMKGTDIFTWLLGWGDLQMLEAFLKFRIIYIFFKSIINSKINKLNNWLNI